MTTLALHLGELLLAVLIGVLGALWFPRRALRGWVARRRFGV